MKEISIKLRCHQSNLQLQQCDETQSTLEGYPHRRLPRCHPFYTGKQKILDSGGHADRFKSVSVTVASDSHSQNIDPPLEDGFDGDLLSPPVLVYARQTRCCRLRYQLHPKIFKH